MSKTVIGMAMGALLAFTLVIAGFWGMLLVALAALIGAGIGRVIEGKLDLQELLNTLKGRKSS